MLNEIPRSHWMECSGMQMMETANNCSLRTPLHQDCDDSGMKSPTQQSQVHSDLCLHSFPRHLHCCPMHLMSISYMHINSTSILHIQYILIML